MPSESFTLPPADALAVEPGSSVCVYVCVLSGYPIPAVVLPCLPLSICSPYKVTVPHCKGEADSSYVQHSTQLLPTIHLIYNNSSVWWWNWAFQMRVLTQC